jgi:hypothetical protein
VPIIYAMKHLLSILILFIALSVKCQSVDYQKKWMDSIESSKYYFHELKTENKIETYQVFDFTPLFFPKHDFLGFIGPDYTRIKIYLSTITKDSVNPQIYHVLGSSIVKKNKCDFAGIISIEKIQEYKNQKIGLDSDFVGKSKTQGILFGKYIFKENSTQKHTGIFEGLVTLTWYVDNFNILHYDNIEWYSDNFKNNQYIGTWTEYNSTIKKVCNWGELRIPFSGDLDIGAGEFSPNSKYLNNGWNESRFK